MRGFQMNNMDTDKQIILNDVEHYAALFNLTETPGGRKLLDALAKDTMSLIENLASTNHTLNDVDLRKLVVTMSVKFLLWRALRNAEANMLGAQEALEQLTK